MIKNADNVQVLARRFFMFFCKTSFSFSAEKGRNWQALQEICADLSSYYSSCFLCKRKRHICAMMVKNAEICSFNSRNEETSEIISNTSEIFI